MHDRKCRFGGYYWDHYPDTLSLSQVTGTYLDIARLPDFHGADMGLTWVLSAPDGPHVGPMNLVIRGHGTRTEALALAARGGGGLLTWFNLNHSMNE